jgi:hypothetical protein
VGAAARDKEEIDMSDRYAITQPMRIQARRGASAEQRYYHRSALPEPWRMPKAIANGVSPRPLEDLIFHGGTIVPQMLFQNIYCGSSADWNSSDVEKIDVAIAAAMRDKRLNNVMAQYFADTTLSCDPLESLKLEDQKPVLFDEPDVQAKIVTLFRSGQIRASDLETTIFNLVLPRGSVLALGDSDSLHGLGGYHGSVHVQHNGRRVTLYSSANVFSEGDNGIPVFDTPWKNVVATLYHELNEFRTDADVKDAIETGDNDFLGWMSRFGRECGDEPIAVAAQLDLVFQEVLTASAGKVPVQFMYSNVVHGPEGPIDHQR